MIECVRAQQCRSGSKYESQICMDSYVWIHGTVKPSSTDGLKKNKKKEEKKNRDLNHVVLHLLSKFGGSCLNV